MNLSDIEKSDLLMSNEPRKIVISFVIPVLNGEKYIDQCLNHIEKEMRDNDEIIVVDNGSTDNTVKIAREHEKAVVLEFPKITIAALRNRGASISKGDILAFVDSDCLLCKGWRQAVESVLSDGIVEATGSHCDVPSSATWVEKAWMYPINRAEMRVNYIPSANFVIRKRAFEAVSGFNETLVTDEDSDFFL